MARHLKLLIVEDSSTDAELLVRELQRAGFDPDWTRVETEEGFLAALEARPELVLSDYSMPRFDGLLAFQRLRESGFEIPFILVSGAVGEDIAVEAMRSGVTDYLLKDRLGRLGSAVERALQTIRLREQRRLADKQRAEAESALRQSESRLRLVTDRACVGLVVVDQDRRYVFANAAYIEIIARPAAELLGRRVSEILPTVFAAQVRPRLDQAFAGNRVDYELHLPGNEHGRFFEINYVPVFDGDQVVNVVVVIMETTRQKRTDTLLRIQDRAIQFAREGILIADATQPNLPIIYVNQGFESITGYSADEVRGRNCRFLQGEGTSPAAIESIRAALHEAIPIKIELLNYRKDGTTFLNNTSITPVRDPSGQLTHFIGIQDDVTEIRSIEEQLRQSQKMDAVGRLAGGLAHDFNNVLAVIDSYTHMLGDDLVESESASLMVRRIQSASSLGANITQQLLTFSRRQHYAAESLDLNNVVRKAMQMTERLLGENIDLNLTLLHELKPIIADPSHLSQVLINLAINARDAMDGHGQLSMKTSMVTVSTPRRFSAFRVEPGEYALLEVTDTGCGMANDVLEHLFEPLFTTKPIGQGTGLGLSTVYGIVTQIGGGIEVDSVVGTGTTFNIYLPVA